MKMSVQRTFILVPYLPMGGLLSEHSLVPLARGERILGHGRLSERSAQPQSQLRELAAALDCVALEALAHQALQRRLSERRLPQRDD
jgi:hypothetical protein